MQADADRNGLIKLVPLEQEEHHGRRALPPERRHRRERHDDAPHTDEVHHGTEASVAAAADDAVIARHLVRGADRRDREDKHELPAEPVRAFGQRAAEGRENRPSQQKNRESRAQADRDKYHLKRRDERMQPLFVPLADGAADHDARRARRAVADNREHLIDLHRDGVRRRHIAAEVAENASLNHLRHAPERLIDEHRERNPHVIAHVARVDVQQLAQVEIEDVFLVFEKPDDDEQLNAPRNQGRAGRAAHAHLREAEVAVNQQIVEADVDNKRRTRNHVADFNHADRAQGRHEDVRDGENHVGEADDAEILRALRDDRRVVREQLQNLRRPAAHQNEQQHRQCAAEAQRHTDDVRDGFELLFAPVLRAHDDRALARANDEHLEQVLYLVAQADAAHRVLTVPTEHERVHHVDAVGQQVLKRKRQRQNHERLIKRLFFYHTVFPPVCPPKPCSCVFSVCLRRIFIGRTLLLFPYYRIFPSMAITKHCNLFIFCAIISVSVTREVERCEGSRRAWRARAVGALFLYARRCRTQPVLLRDPRRALLL